MKHVLRTVLVAALLAPPAHAQTRPDFSGTWTMDPTRSESAMQGEPIGPVVIVIAQSDSELRMDITRKEGTTTVVYRLDGSESRIPGGTSRSHWDGATLVTEAQRDIHGQTVTTKESRSLNADRSEMVVDSLLVVQHGYTLKGSRSYGSGKDVYTRVKP